MTEYIAFEKQTNRLKYCCPRLCSFMGRVESRIRYYDTEPLWIGFNITSGFWEESFSFCPFCGKKLEIEDNMAFRI